MPRKFFFLEETLALEFSSAKRYDAPLCAARVDPDDFTKINDTLSHQIGDEVLRTTAKIFMQFVKEVDIVARYSGEEFALIFPQTPLSGGVGVTLSISVAADLSV